MNLLYIFHIESRFVENTFTPTENEESDAVSEIPNIHAMYAYNYSFSSYFFLRSNEPIN